MKSRFILTPIAAATLALGGSLAMATTHDATKPTAETRSSVPQITNKQGTAGTTGSTTTPATGSTATTGSTGTTGTAAGAPRVPGVPNASGTIRTPAAATGSTNRSTAQAGGMRDAQSWDRQHRASKIIGMDVVNRQGEKIGEVEDIVVDTRGNVAYAVVSTGTFLAVGERLHAVPWNSLQRDQANTNLVVDVDRDRLRNAPGFERNNWPDVTNQQWRQQNQRYWPQARAGQTGTGVYGTDVDKDRMRTDRPAATGSNQPAGQAPAPRVGKPPYGTDVDKDRMGTDRPAATGGNQPSGQAPAPRVGTPPYGTDVDKDRMRDKPASGTGAAGTTNK